MNILKCGIAFVIAIELWVPCDGLQLVSTSGPLKTTKSLLMERGVSLDRNSLLTALRSSDESTRSLAAQELADQHDADAAPDIEEAFRSSRESLTHFNLAQALVQVDAVKGKVLLAEICQSSIEKSAIRLESIKLIRHLGSHGCDRFIQDLAVRAEDPQVKIGALTVLLDDPSQEDDRHVSLVVEKSMLDDDNTAVRLAAASALTARGGSTALAILQKRLNVEKDIAIRERLKQDCREIKLLDKDK